MTGVETACPSCERPEAEYQTLSKHTTSEGVVIYARCACGLLQVRLRPYGAETERLVITAGR